MNRMKNKLPNGMTKMEMLESLKSYTDFPEVIDEAIDAMNKSKSNKYLINNDNSMTRVKAIEHIDRMIDTYKICKINGVGIDIPIDEDLEALIVARDTLCAIDIQDNPTNGNNNVENKIKYKEHSEDIVELEDVNNTMISIHDLVAYYNQIQIMKSEGIYPEDMTFYFSCECEMNNESEE